MIALVGALLCARILLAGLGFVLGLVLALAGVAIELSYATLRWVVYPVATGAWWVCRHLFVRHLATSIDVSTASLPLSFQRGAAPRRALARQHALFTGVRAARLHDHR